MRAVAIILLVVCLGMIGLTGYLYLTANVTITGIDCVAVDAANQEAVFAGLKEQVSRGIFTGTPFDISEIGNAGDYQFYTYTVHLRNDTFVMAEVAEVQVAPMNGDVLQTEEPQPRAIPARGEGDVQGTILTGKEMHNVRELTVTYYLWGLPFSLRTTYNSR